MMCPRARTVTCLPLAVPPRAQAASSRLRNSVSVAWRTARNSATRSASARRSKPPPATNAFSSNDGIGDVAHDLADAPLVRRVAVSRVLFLDLAEQRGGLVTLPGEQCEEIA